MRALNIAASGMLAQQLNVEVISNNLANLSTTGYKRQIAQFKDLLYQTQQAPGAAGAESGTVIPTGIQLGLGVTSAGVYHDVSQGNMQQTGGPLDVAIQGKGYFQVTLPSGDIGYTRAGSFATSPEGELETSEGYPLSGGITIPANAKTITISTTGVVTATIDGQATPTNLGQLELATFINPNGLDALGDNLYQETAASGSPQTGAPGEVGFGTVLQNYVEASNVDSVKEITNLIVAQRSYEMNSKVITAADQMMQTTSQLKS